MIEIAISSDIRAHCPKMVLGCLQCRLIVQDSSAALLHLIDLECARIKSQIQVENIHALHTIADTREAYKALGKEPSRYRPSAEALIRRVIQGKGLYQVNNVVDLLNLVSIQFGFSIGGWDAEKIEGKAVLGVGCADERYLTIGRGEMNIEFFPTFRDELGAFGTPTSDSERTMVRPETVQFLMVFYAFGGREDLNSAMVAAKSLLETYADGSYFETKITSN